MGSLKRVLTGEFIRKRYLLQNQRTVFRFFVTRRAQECGNSREPSDPVNWYAVRNKMRDIKGKFVGNCECQDSPPSPSTRSKRSVISRDHVHRRYAMPKSCARTSSGLRHSPVSVETKQPTAAGGDFVIEVVYRGVMSPPPT